ncbi:DNA polymerase-3 subunit epsilon [Alkalispirochaeta americana]|uniref:DNA polymerase-3 subunit epsilon n=1 Tax=Alkalispirochaeta americana TaxID=159291 RepID=A0A1N6T1E4_9SPIO|nr:3'-5' exonuclease [Alkalispirochaeta americana]SIQ47140.1 DNA polymerase-3 subunit epsilon [Alkalispirochaeta americana]
MIIDPTLSVSSCTFVAFDFETTGLYPAVDRVVEFGAVRFMPGKEIADFNELCNPEMAIHPEASRVSGITDAMVADKPLAAVILPRFMDFVGESILVAHNAGFDTAFLRAELQRAGMPTVPNLIIDTQVLAKRAFPGKKSYALQNLVEMLGIPANTAHRARDDARQCARLFEHCVGALSFMGDLELSEVLT